jgi:nitrite reductase/ring-hydroxylating ferredoxin subunit
MTMPCEHCINRRAFISAAAGVAGLSVLSGCGDGDLAALAPEFFPGEFDPITITVADFPALANTGILVGIPERSFAVKRTGPATFVALSTRCTHQGCIVNISSNGQQLDCPCHASRFSSDGAVLRGPAQDPLPTFSTSYNPGSDQLTIS